MVTETAYAELGLAPGASEAEVKAAWRRLVARWHPDRNRSGDAIGRMQRINQAFEVLRSAGFELATEARGDAAGGTPGTTGTDTDTDATGTDATGTDATGTDAPEDQAPSGRTLSRKIKLTLEEAAAGCVKPVRGRLLARCPHCDGSGDRAPPAACPECQGSGQVRKGSWYGWLGTLHACDACAGEGRQRQVCAACDGSGRLPARDYRLSVRIPHGVRHGDLLHVPGRRGASGQPPLHLDLRVELQPHPLFALDDDGTIRCEMPVDAFAWIANRAVDVPTLDGPQRLQLSRDRLEYRLAGQGFPTERRGPRGDHCIRVEPVFPERLDGDQQILLEQLAATTGARRAPQAGRLADWGRRVGRWDKGRSRRGA